MFFYKVFLLLLTSLLITPVLATETDNRSSQSNTSKRPAPPKRIPPNKVKPGGGLSFARQACTASKSSLTALIPIENPVLTAKAYPSFLFYIPDRPAAMSHGEFTLFTAEEKTRVYAAKVNLKNTPGIIKIDLPNDAQYALKEKQPYHWYFKVYCQESNSTVYLDVDGWIERVPASYTTSRQNETMPGIWYDAIATTVQALLDAPQDPTIRQQWLKLLQFIDREHLVDANIQSIPTATTELSQKALK